MSTQTTTQPCPECGEENPVEALLCWNCAGELRRTSEWTPAHERAMQEDEAGELRLPSSRTWRDKIENYIPFLFLGFMISSGWWRGKTRFGFLGAGAAMLVLYDAWVRREQAKQAPLLRYAPGGAESPTSNLAGTILYHAVHDGASQVRISRPEKGLLRVEYQIDGQWREKMKLRLRLWNSIQDQFSRRVSKGIVKNSFSFEVVPVSPSGAPRFDEEQPGLTVADREAAFSLRILNEPPHGEILLTRLEMGN